MLFNSFDSKNHLRSNNSSMHHNNNNNSSSNITKKVSTSSSTSSSSAQAKRVQTWMEGFAVLGQRSKLVSSDTNEAWSSVLRSASTETACSSSSSSSSLMTTPYHEQQHLQQQYQNATNALLGRSFDLESEQILQTHRHMLQAQERLKKDQLGLASLVSNATEELDLGDATSSSSSFSNYFLGHNGEGDSVFCQGGGEGTSSSSSSRTTSRRSGGDGSSHLHGPSVARVRAATTAIDSTLSALRNEEKALGDVVAEAECVCATITKKMLLSQQKDFNQQKNQNSNNNTKKPSTNFGGSGLRVLSSNQQSYPNKNNDNMAKKSHNSIINNTECHDQQQQRQQHHHHQDPTTAMTATGREENFATSPADEKLKQFLQKNGGRTFHWPRNEHEIFMHALFSGGFEDASHTHATPNLGLRPPPPPPPSSGNDVLSQNNSNNTNQQHQNYYSADPTSSTMQQHQHQQHLCDDDQWVAARIIEKITPLLPHRLPDDIRKHLHLQRELEFLEGQRRLEIRSWRDQREADATMDLGLAAALARQDTMVEEQSRKESEFERRQRQEHLHELVERWKQKKDEAAATASAAMAMTQRALEDAKISRRQAMQAASTERTRQLLERRKMQKSAALWSTCAKQLGVAASSSSSSSSCEFGCTSNHHHQNPNTAFGSRYSPPSCVSNLTHSDLKLALAERREQDMIKARQRRQQLEEADRRKHEKDDILKAKLLLTSSSASSSSSPNSGGRANNNNNNNNHHRAASSSAVGRDPSRLLQPTVSTSARRVASCTGGGKRGETDANFQTRVLCRQTPYLTPRTYVSHRRGAPFG